MKFFGTVTFGNGATQWELIEADSPEEADRMLREVCIDFASSYGYDQNVGYFGDYDQLCNEDSWCEEEREYTDIGELDYYAVGYDPEEHDGYLT